MVEKKTTYTYHSLFLNARICPYTMPKCSVILEKPLGSFAEAGNPDIMDGVTEGMVVGVRSLRSWPLLQGFRV